MFVQCTVNHNPIPGDSTWDFVSDMEWERMQTPDEKELQDPCDPFLVRLACFGRHTTRQQM